MKIAYILAVLFFPVFLFIDVTPSSITGVAISENKNSKTIETSYNFRQIESDQDINQNISISPKNSSYTELNEVVTEDRSENDLKEIKTTKSEEPVIEEMIEAEDIEEEVKFNHSILDRILIANVSNSGKVNYKGIKAKISDLESYLNLISQNKPQSNWTRNEKLAYWINAYNAFTLKLIVDNYPIKSITNLDGGKPWDKKWIKIGNNTYSLNNIENDIIRVEFDEPRIHFAVNCAAKSCPPLLNAAWTAGNLETNLEKQTRSFINNKKYNQVAPNSVSVSKIFDWYKEDFGDLISFLNTYSAIAIGKDAKVAFMEYDWSLNE